jgi:hypothetical protein
MSNWHHEVRALSDLAIGETTIPAGTVLTLVPRVVMDSWLERSKSTLPPDVISGVKCGMVCMVLVKTPSGIKPHLIDFELLDFGEHTFTPRHPFPEYKPMTLEEKVEKAIFRHGPFIVMEMPADEAFLHQEGLDMRHCLQQCYSSYSQRIASGSQRHFSLVDTRDGKPKVDIELSISNSSYSGPVAQPSVTQIRGIENQCPPSDEYIRPIVEFIQSQGFKAIGHDVSNFDGQCDGQLVWDRWLELQDVNGL